MHTRETNTKLQLFSLVSNPGVFKLTTWHCGPAAPSTAVFPTACHVVDMFLGGDSVPGMKSGIFNCRRWVWVMKGLLGRLLQVTTS